MSGVRYISGAIGSLQAQRGERVRITEPKEGSSNVNTSEATEIDTAAPTEPAPDAPSTDPIGTASFSPEDNKIRVTPFARLDADTYARVKAAGFCWAPRQKIFVAPMWTPERADLAEELCGEIGDEDTSLVDRAEDRAERFEGYGENRAADAHAARAAVEAVAGNIPMGQPILCGHASEKRARRDAERIKSGMRKAVKLWETSKYWKDRAAGAIRHAKYIERADVRHRRIKGLEADKRRHVRDVERSVSFTKLWNTQPMNLKSALAIANHDHNYSSWSKLNDGTMTAEAARDLSLAAHARTIATAERWIAHIDNRIAYETAMLGEAGGIVTDHFDIQIGGRVLVSPGGWYVVKGVNKSDGKVTSVSLVGSYVRGVEKITDYRAPEAGAADKVKSAKKLPPIVNYPGEGFKEVTAALWKRMVAAGSGQMRVQKATETHGAYRYRDTFGAEWRGRQVYVTDAKRVDPPAVAAPAVAEERAALVEDLQPIRVPASPRPRREEPAPTVFDAMKESLRNGGVQVVQADQLFATPDALADQLVAAAGIEPGDRVLEPSAGTGQLVRAIKRACPTAEVTAYEINEKLAAATGAGHVDFLLVNPELKFRRCILNPPFANGADVDHVMHAYRMLADGGRLVAIMSGGVAFKQDERTTAFRALVDACGGTIEKLPADSFKVSGTGVHTVLVTMPRSA